MISSTFFQVALVLGGSFCVYWLLPRNLRLGFLAIASFSLLFTIEPVGSCVLAGWSSLFYWIAPRLTAPGSRWRRWMGPALILGILGYLAYHKYIPPLVAAMSLNPIEKKVVLPLGISYFTFKLIHYAVEVGRGNIKDRNLQQFFCYIFLFPIFTAGPIERFDHFLANQDERWNLRSMVEGLTRIIHGVIKKFVLAAAVWTLVEQTDADYLLSHLSEVLTFQVWLYCALVFIYVYLDFSAYSDIAIGSARLFGLRIMENFNWPIFAPDIGAFWTRWHMTLARWCQAYVYLPTIGLTRNPYLAVYSSFLAIGLWHAGSMNFVFWGLYHATAVSVFQAWRQVKRRRRWKFTDRYPWRCLSVPITLLVVVGSFACTASPDSHNALDGLRVLCKLVAIDFPA